jgi:Fur family zinc uptake transcriptional regulator
LLRRNMKVRTDNSPVPHGFFRFGSNPLEYRLYSNGSWAAPTPGAAIQTIMSPAIFLAPDHDHERCTSAAIAHAETQCVARGQRLTPMRRQVLEALLSSHRPLGAYEIIDRLQQKTRPAPITVYRALEFLRDNGLVHRIESRNAFVACVHNHEGGDLVIFLICERCGAVGEAPGGGAAEALKVSSRAAGFSPKSPLIEVAGICAHCRDR